MSKSKILEALSDRLTGVTKNAAGGNAYKLDKQDALVQYAFTGTFANSYYVGAEAKLSTVLELCSQCSPKFVAQTAIASRSGHMKDMPAMLAAYLHSVDPHLLAHVFDRVIDNGLMLRNFVQIVRSGAIGRKSFGSKTRNTIRKWLENRNEFQLMYDSIGGGNKAGDVSLEHVIRMVRPKPKDNTRSAFYAWMLGASVVGDKLVQEVHFVKNKKAQSGCREYNTIDLPKNVQKWIEFKANPKDELPKVPFRMITGLPLNKEQWINIAKLMSWQELRQNLQTLSRHGVFDDQEMVAFVSDKLRNPELIAKARVMPYQLLAAYINVTNTDSHNSWQSISRDDKKSANSSSIPKDIIAALEIAMEESIKNIPCLEGEVYICPDISGSMAHSITGNNYSQVASKIRCIDVAGLIAASVLRRNPLSKVLPFGVKVHDIAINPLDSVMKNTTRLASLLGGGTACSKPLEALNTAKANVDVIVFISDYESWADTRLDAKRTAMMLEWEIIKERNPAAKMICIDLTPQGTSQVEYSPDILRIGGFSDAVYHLMRDFINGKLGHKHWVETVESIKIIDAVKV